MFSKFVIERSSEISPAIKSLFEKVQGLFYNVSRALQKIKWGAFKNTTSFNTRIKNLLKYFEIDKNNALEKKIATLKPVLDFINHFSAESGFIFAS